VRSDWERWAERIPVGKPPIVTGIVKNLVIHIRRADEARLRFLVKKDCPLMKRNSPRLRSENHELPGQKISGSELDNAAVFGAVSPFVRLVLYR
jgi:hypothetical protein